VSGWLHELPVIWLALVVVAAMALVTATILFTVMRLAAGDRGAAVKTVSPGMLPPMAIVFSLTVAFMAAGVWGDVDRAEDAVDAEASALRSAVLLSDGFSTATQAQMRALIRRHIDDAVRYEWPQMERQRAGLSAIPAPLAEALALALGLSPQREGQVVAQREMVATLQRALDARRVRIVISGSGINVVRWAALLALAVLTLAAMACVHSANRTAAAVAMGLFAAAVATVVVMLASQDRPFTGQLGIDPDVLVQVKPPP
jgi:hypothetical protein